MLSIIIFISSKKKTFQVPSGIENEISDKWCLFPSIIDIPVDTGRKLNVLCTFNLRPVSTAIFISVVAWNGGNKETVTENYGTSVLKKLRNFKNLGLFLVSFRKGTCSSKSISRSEVIVQKYFEQNGYSEYFWKFVSFFNKRPVAKNH